MIRRPALLAAAGACALAVTVSCTTTQQSPAPAPVSWQSVAKTDVQEAFVEGASIKAVAGAVEAAVKQDFTQAQPAAKQGSSYLSTRSLYRFDCAQRRIAMKEVRAYEATGLQGAQVQKATSSDKNLQWLEAPKGTVFGELLDHVCAAVPGA